MCYLVFTLTSSPNLNLIKPYNAGLKMKYRGDRATGIAFRDKQAGITRVIKTKGDITNLKKIFEKVKTDRILIHGRLPTTGDSSVAHPFLDRDRQIILIHNGGWHNYSGALIALKAFGYPVKHGVDSEVIAYLIGALMNKEKGKLLERLEKAVITVFNEVDFHGFIWVTDKAMRVFYGLSKNGDNALWVDDDLFAMTSTVEGLKEIVGDVAADEVKTLTRGIIKVWKKKGKIEWEIIDSELETYTDSYGWRRYRSYSDYTSWSWFYDPEREDWVSVNWKKSKESEGNDEKKKEERAEVTESTNENGKATTRATKVSGKEVFLNKDISIYDSRLVCDYKNLGWCVTPKAYIKHLKNKLPKWLKNSPDLETIVEYVIGSLDFLDDTDVLDIIMSTAQDYDKVDDSYIITLFEVLFHMLVQDVPNYVASI